MDILTDAFAVMGFILAIVALSYATQAKHRIDEIEKKVSGHSGDAP